MDQNICGIIRLSKEVFANVDDIVRRHDTHNCVMTFSLIKFARAARASDLNWFCVYVLFANKRPV